MERFESQYNNEHDVWIISHKESNSRIDSKSAPDLEKQGFDLISKKRLNVIIDLKNPSHISESALKVMFKIIKEIKRLDGSIVLCGMKEHISKYRDPAAEYIPIVLICDTVNEAIETFGSKLKKKKSWFKWRWIPRW